MAAGASTLAAGPSIISNVQALRAFCALAVVYHHAPFKVFGVESQFLGVPIFFCISGFIMTYITRSDASYFLARRLVRIVPAYWIATLILFFFSHLGLLNPTRTLPMLWNSPGSIWSWIATNSGLGDPAVVRGLAKSLLFIPYDNHGLVMPVLGIGWTLNLEMYFYVLFALALAVTASFAPAIVALFVAAAAVMVNVLPVSPEAAFYGQHFVFCFVTGIGCYYVWRYIPEEVYRKAKRIVVIATVAVYVAVFVLCAATSRTSALLAFIELTVPPVVLFCALACHSAGARVRSRPVLFLGAASYSIYLIHLIVFSAYNVRDAGYPLEALLHAPVRCIAWVVLGTVAGIAFFVAVERPLLRALGAWIPARSIELGRSPERIRTLGA